MRSLQAEADEVRVRVDDAKHFSLATSDDLIELASRDSALRSAEEAVADKRREIEMERRSLGMDGTDADRTAAPYARLEELSAAEREFVRLCPETQMKLSAESSRAQLECAQAESALQAIKQRRKSARSIGRGLTGIGVFLVIVAGVLALEKSTAPSAIVAVAGIAAAAIGAVRCGVAGGILSDEKARLESSAESARINSEQAQSQIRENDERLLQIARRLGLSDARALADSFRDCERELGRSEALNALRARLAQAEETLTAAQGSAAEILGRLGSRCQAGDEDLHAAIARVRTALQAYLNDRDALNGCRRGAAELEREITNKHKSVKYERAILDSVLSDAGIKVEPGSSSIESLESALRAFNEAEGRYRRYVQIKDSLLPAAGKHVVSSDELDRLKSEDADLTQRLGGLPVETARGSSEIESERLAVRSELDHLLDTIRELEKEVGSCVDEYHGEYPVLLEDLGKLKRRADKVSRFSAALELATEVMSAVSEDTHKRWSAALNRQAAMILPRLSPDYKDLHFDESLNFTVRYVPDNRIIEKPEIDTCLSTGTKDQIYLAVRLACCLELSRQGESMPILLDDPLIAADDNRFREVIKCLAESIAPDCQVIVLSCHKSRHESLADKSGSEKM